MINNTCDLLTLLDKHTKKELFSLIAKLQSYSSRIYIVGGTVRDCILKRDSHKDIDLEVYDITQEQLEVVASEIGASGVGKSFFVYKFKNFDIALPRIEIKIAKGYCGFHVALTQEEYQATKRRDFTINALLYDVFSGRILDPFGGICDIKTQTIRAVSKQSFCEDPLRVLRGIRFAAMLGFAVEAETLILMNQADLREISIDRVALEFLKISSAPHQSYGVYYLYRLAILQKIFKINFNRKMFLFMMRCCRLIVKNSFAFNARQEYFLYSLKYILGLNSLHEISLFGPCVKTVDKEILLKSNFNTVDLLNIASNKAICEFFGCFVDRSIEITAKKYGVFFQKLALPFSTKTIHEEGFVGIQIKHEFQKRKRKFIEEFIATHDAQNAIKSSTV